MVFYLPFIFKTPLKAHFPAKKTTNNPPFRFFYPSGAFADLFIKLILKINNNYKLERI